VLLGDLNMPPPFPRALTEVAGAGTHAHLSRLGAQDPARPRARVRALPAVTAVEAPRLAVSDHRALLVELAGS
jgi:endonuclease/exonuclease/phosphatase family metal-dependent hydrolase